MIQCKECGVKLRARNHRKRKNGYKSRHVCQACWGKPKEENRCTAIATSKQRCRLRKTDGSEYCGIHSRKLE
jgi:hypothetical protein